MNGNESKPDSASDNSPKSHNRDDGTNDQYVHKDTDLKPNCLTNNDQIIVQKPEVDQTKTVRLKTGAKHISPPNVTQNSGNYYFNVFTNRFLI